MMHKFRHPRRPAFTLTEILVVIAIIAILAAMAGWAVFATIGGQQRNNTQATIKVVNKVLQTHWQKVVEDARKDTISPAVVALAQPDPTGERAQVLWIKFRLVEAFPQSFAEIGTPAAPPWFYNAPVPDPNGYGPYIPAGQGRYITAYQKNIPAPLAASHLAATEPGACLLMALSVSRGGTVLGQDQIGYAVADTDSDRVKELVDSWNRPLVFTRFDVSANVQAANPAAAGAKNKTFADPLDPDGTLLNSAWYGTAAAPSASRTFFESKFHTIETAPGSGIANYVIPSIISLGKDGLPGTPDDIISYQLR